MTSVEAWPDHLLSLAEWDELAPIDQRRMELAEGVLQVSPRPSSRHQLVGYELQAALDAAFRPDWRALAEVELTVDRAEPPTVRVPDVVIARAAVVDARTRQDPSDVLAVVEIVSPGSRRTDRVTKLAEYADAGIAHYLVVEPGPPVAVAEFRLVDRRLTLVAEHRGLVTLALGQVTLDLDAI